MVTERQMHEQVLRCARLTGVESNRFVTMLNAFLGEDNLSMEACLDLMEVRGFSASVGDFGEPIIRRVTH